MIRPGLVSVTFRDLSAREVVDLAAASGLEAIEWGGGFHVTDVASALETRRIGEDRGLAVAAFGSYWRTDGEFGPTLEVAVGLGAPTIRVWAGTLGSADEPDRVKIVKALWEACDLAGAAGLTVSLEYHGGTLTDTLESTLQLVKEVAHPALKLYWQPVPERSHEERLRELRAVAPFLTNLHVFQWTKPQAEIVRHPLTEGKREWPEYLATASGDRFALLEFVPNNDPSILKMEAKTLRGWVEAK